MQHSHLPVHLYEGQTYIEMEGGFFPPKFAQKWVYVATPVHALASSDVLRFSMPPEEAYVPFYYSCWSGENIFYNSTCLIRGAWTRFETLSLYHAACRNDSPFLPPSVEQAPEETDGHTGKAKLQKRLVENHQSGLVEWTSLPIHSGPGNKISPK